MVIQMPGADYFAQMNLSHSSRRRIAKDFLKQLPQVSLSRLLLKWLLTYHLAIYVLKPGFPLHKTSELLGYDALNTLVDNHFRRFLLCYLHNTAKGVLSRITNRKGLVGRYR